MYAVKFHTSHSAELSPTRPKLWEIILRSWLGEIVKISCQKPDIYIYYIYMTLLIIDMDFLYQFNMGLIAPFFTVSFHEKFEKKMFFKIFKSWQVWDWLAKWIIMLRFMDLRWPRVFRRSNVGLVILKVQTTCKKMISEINWLHIGSVTVSIISLSGF